MTIDITSFTNLSPNLTGRVVLGNDQLVDGHQCWLGRRISIMTGTRQAENRAVYDEFARALESEYGPAAAAVLKEIVANPRTRLTGNAITQVIQLADSKRQTSAATTLALEARVSDKAALEGVGVNPKKTHVSERNVATSRLNQLLQLNVIPLTELATGRVNDEIEPGVVMGPAPGVPPKKTRYEFELTEEIGNERLANLARIKQQLGNDITKLGSLARHCDLIGMRWDRDGVKLIAEANVTVGLNFRDPVLVEKLNDLQWLDALCAQEFRNGENYVVQQGDQGQVVSVLGINNGQAFGSEIVDPDQLNHENGNDYFGCGLPDVISRQTADKILKLSSDELTQALSSLLKPAEVEACQARLLVIQKKIGLLNEAGKIIENSPWNVGSQGDENALFENVMTDSYRSYVARDADNRGYIKIDHQVFANGGANSKDSSAMTMEGLSDE